MKTKTRPGYCLKYATATGVLGLLLLVSLPAAVAVANSSSAEAEEEKIVLGWLQSVRLLPAELRLTAKLDSGAKSSALHAVDIEIWEEGDDEIVGFNVPVEKKGKTVMLHYEQLLVKESKVKRHERDELDIRPVVEMDFCIDGSVYRAQFSLDDREKFNYPVLLGRSFLQHQFLIDSSKTFVKKYHCP